MRSEGKDDNEIYDYIDCIMEAWDDVKEGAYCNSLMEVGFCDDVSRV